MGEAWNLRKKDKLFQPRKNELFRTVGGGGGGGGRGKRLKKPRVVNGGQSR